jgi:phosphate transport system protein
VEGELRQFTVELDELNQKMLQMAGMVESSINRAIRALMDKSQQLAEEVIRDEPLVNQMEMELDGMATRLLALRQPVARDLRRLTAFLKITTDLERIGDLAVHIAERSLSLMHHPPASSVVDIPKMASMVQSMLLKVLEAFVHADAGLARSVLLADSEVDAMRDFIYSKLVATMQTDASMIPSAIDLIFVARNLERIGDHATNIAEDVIFMIEGVDVRHHASQPAAIK